LGDVVQAHIDPTGYLILQFEDSHLELKDLSEEKNRDRSYRRCHAKIQKLNKSAKTQDREPHKTALKYSKGNSEEL